MNTIILEALKLGLWRQFDVQFAYMLVKSCQHSLALSIITLSSYINRGHVCLPLVMLTPQKLFFGSHIVLANKVCERFGNLSINCWKKLLFDSSVVSDGSFLAPLVLDKEKLYLYHMWKDECLISNFFSLSSQKLLDIPKKKTDQIIKLLNQFFPQINNKKNEKHCVNKKYVDWQKVSVAMMLTRKIVVISGGPGTGKTTIVSKFLIIVSLLNSNFFLNIKLAAPTGKAVARLNESIHLMIKNLCLINNNYKENNCSIESVTLHRLLGLYSSNKQNIKRAQYNFISLDYLIIDECSMIDLSMFSKIIILLPPQTNIILLGDHKQLPSIEPGSVFSDICYFIGNGYTSAYCKQLKKLTNYILPINKYNQYSIFNNFCLLSKNYRFSAISGINKLANAISMKDHSTVLSLLTKKSNIDLNYVILKDREDYFNMLINCASGYLNYFKNITFNHKSYTNLKHILNIFNQFRVLCVLREGPFGVLELNLLIEKILNEYGLIRFEDNNQNYIGRPIIITINKPSLSLFNGEIGIILSNNNEIDNFKLCAYFLSLDGNIKKIALHKLPEHETSFVMTVHKAQGSEFESVSLIFPDQIIPVLTNELFYTGVTRACKYLSIYANNQTVIYAINNIYKRHSGLIERLKEIIV